MSNYEQIAMDFANKYGVKLDILEIGYRKYWPEDDVCRYVFKCRLRRGGRQYTFEFGQSIADGAKEPTMYDVLACLVKVNPGDLREFCDEYGYEYYDVRTRDTYKKVCREWKGVERLFVDVMDELREIN